MTAPALHYAVLAGVVAVWDVTSSRVVAEYEAHAKRVWSLDYCAAPGADPGLLASASDDCTVKIWSAKTPNSVGQVREQACS
jgi:WD40 repeat protein